MINYADYKFNDFCSNHSPENKPCKISNVSFVAKYKAVYEKLKKDFDSLGISYVENHSYLTYPIKTYRRFRNAAPKVMYNNYIYFTITIPNKQLVYFTQNLYVYIFCENAKKSDNPINVVITADDGITSEVQYINDYKKYTRNVVCHAEIRWALDQNTYVFSEVNGVINLSIASYIKMYENRLNEISSTQAKKNVVSNLNLAKVYGMIKAFGENFSGKQCEYTIDNLSSYHGISYYKIDKSLHSKAAINFKNRSYDNNIACSINACKENKDFDYHAFSFSFNVNNSNIHKIFEHMLAVANNAMQLASLSDNE